ncbi:hypothetical protein D9611_011816 [Ephemerocybe angulata]|uniref:Chromo domain-containing protein n=1 Tax=Ephemerocybe angulata TaxID=980116 RepID=A0A8H5F4L2_9AGAR|nr:hypothetical protein D9611_005712 [Tulosesus angulatus]KAF5331324.1 hypothetical protein D9611_011816 [Tulosesus angulatus]
MIYDPTYKRPPLAYCSANISRLPPEVDAQGDARWYINNIVDCIQLDDDYFYRVRWLTCSEAEDTWEKEEDLQGSAALRKWRYYQQIPRTLPITTIVDSRPYSNCRAF